MVMCAVFFTYWANYVDKMHKELNSGYNKVLFLYSYTASHIFNHLLPTRFIYVLFTY